MFRITEDPSSRSLVQCLAKITKNCSIVSVDMYFQKLAELVLLSLSTSTLPLHTTLPVLLVSYIL